MSGERFGTGRPERSPVRPHANGPSPAEVCVQDRRMVSNLATTSFPIKV